MSLQPGQSGAYVGLFLAQSLQRLPLTMPAQLHLGCLCEVASTERLCSTPLDQLDEDERMKAEAIC